MISINISEDQRARARKISNPDLVLKRNRTGKRAGYIGALGEIVVADYLGIKPHNDSEIWNYDMKFNDTRIEVKTMNLYREPQSFTDCCTTTYYTQNCDMYVFVGLLHDKSRAWIEGCIPTSEFYNRAKFIKAGTRRERDGFTYNWDNWVVSVSDLYDVGEKLK